MDFDLETFLMALYVMVDDLYQSHIQPCTPICGGPLALMRGCSRSSCHQAGENGCSCPHTWHILGTGLRAKDFEPVSFPCAEEPHSMPVSYRKIAAEECTDTKYTLAEDPAAYARQAQQMSGSSQGAQLEVYTLHSPLDAIQQH